MNVGNATGNLPCSSVPNFLHSLSAIASFKIGAEPRICPLPSPKSFLSSSENLSRLLGISVFGKKMFSI